MTERAIPRAADFDSERCRLTHDSCEGSAISKPMINESQMVCSCRTFKLHVTILKWDSHSSNSDALPSNYQAPSQAVGCNATHP